MSQRTADKAPSPEKRGADKASTPESASDSLASAIPTGARLTPDDLRRPPPGRGLAHQRQQQVLALQQTLGNRYTRLLIQRDPVITAPLGGGTHTVQPGDSLWEIARRTYGDGSYWRQIYDANPGKIGRDGCLILTSAVLDLPRLDVPVASGQPTTGSPSTPPPTSTATPQPSTPNGGQSTPQASQTPATGGSPTATARTCMYPAFRYNLPSIPVSVAPMVTPSGTIIFTLALRGNLNAQKHGSCLPWSIDQTGLRVEANEVIGQFTSGLRVNSIGSDSMSLGVTFAGPFNSTEVRFTPPSRMTYICQTRNIGFAAAMAMIRGGSQLVTR